jgi:NAD(P)-dependent dehydrogenase (short-subunit alcohol dehydrogenase family)
MKSLENKVVAITGAGSGIGRALALQLAATGSALALADVNEEGLAQTVALAGKVGQRISSHRVDVADRVAVHAWAAEVRAIHGTAHVVINNAGVTLSASVADMSIDDFRWLMDINFWGVVHGTQAFLPGFLAQDEGHVVNVSSSFGIIGVPSQSAYNAAKFAVRGFTESLRQEIASSNVRATCVHPGGIRTNIVRTGRHYSDLLGGSVDMQRLNREFNLVAQTSPRQAASAIIDGILQDRPRVLIGPDAHVIDHLARLLPESYDKVMLTMGKLGRRLTD